MNDHGYNFIYEKLVSSDDDLVGLIAYGIYKKHKIEFISKIKEEEKRAPTSEECKSFFTASTTESQLGHYRDQAETILSEGVGNIASEEFSRYEKQMLRDYENKIKSCLPSNLKNFGMSVLAGFVSAFLFAVSVGAYIFIANTSEKSTQKETKYLMEQVQKASDSIK